MLLGRSWPVVATLLVALPFGAGHAMAEPPGPPEPPSTEIVTGTVGQQGTPRLLPVAPGDAFPPPEIERGLVAPVP